MSSNNSNAAAGSQHTPASGQSTTQPSQGNAIAAIGRLRPDNQLSDPSTECRICGSQHDSPRDAMKICYWLQWRLCLLCYHEYGIKAAYECRNTGPGQWDAKVEARWAELNGVELDEDEFTVSGYMMDEDSDAMDIDHPDQIPDLFSIAEPGPIPQEPTGSGQRLRRGAISIHNVSGPLTSQSEATIQETHVSQSQLNGTGPLPNSLLQWPEQLTTWQQPQVTPGPSQQADREASVASFTFDDYTLAEARALFLDPQLDPFQDTDGSSEPTNGQ